MAESIFFQRAKVDSDTVSTYSSASSTDEEHRTRRREMEQAEVRTSFNLDLEHTDVLETVASLLRAYENDDYYAYEREGTWHVGLGSRASLSVDAEGKNATINSGGKVSVRKFHGTIADVAREFVHKTKKHGGGRIYGQVGFNYAMHVRGFDYGPGEWPMLAMLAPLSEVEITNKHVTVIGHDYDATIDICTVLQGATHSFDLTRPIDVNTDGNSREYQARVANAILDIKKGRYIKIIASRALELEEKVDMPATLVKGRRGNTPARSFCLKHGTIKATGFSPELVLCLDNGKVITEPLAGTRSRAGTKEEVAERRLDLLSDTKEIVEHVLSVQAAMDELHKLCKPKSVVVEELMAVRERGSVQHLGSRLAGSLLPGKDGWDAFNILFPAITASGIPKGPALEAIVRLEPRPRELYSGAVLMIEGTHFFEATLVLRTVFQDDKRSWIQAGAGIIAQSLPAREWIETKEKLASVAPFLVGKGDQMPQDELGNLVEKPAAQLNSRPALRGRQWSSYTGLSK